MPLYPLSRAVRPQDVVWLILFGALIATAARPDFSLSAMLATLAVAQVLEPRIPEQPTTRSRIAWFVLKLLLGYLLIGYTGGIDSVYWPVLLLPVVSAATAFSIGSLVMLAVAAGSYLSFLFFVDWSLYTMDWPEKSVLATRVIFLAILGNLANILVEDLRIQSESNRQTAEQLAQVNVQLRQAEEAVRRSDRLAALGQLSAGLAHELRNPLGTIRGSSELLMRNVGSENEIAREVAGFIAAEVDRCNSLVTRFLQFARPLQLRLDKADLSRTLDRAVEEVTREAKGIAIYKNYSPDIAPFRFDAELMERVFYNLILNAAQATAPGGAVTVKTRAVPGTVEIAVIDRGSGIDPAQRDSIFNPFFTTKPEGVGLGLAIVAKIVDEHGGKIAVESDPGKGSIFRVLLPALAG